jgi:Leucine-rich repeat (LRR) protein
MARISSGFSCFSGGCFSGGEGTTQPNPATNDPADSHRTRPINVANMPAPVGNSQSQRRTAAPRSANNDAPSPETLCRQELAQWVTNAARNSPEAKSQADVTNAILDSCMSQTPSLELNAGHLTSLPNCLSAMTWLNELTINNGRLTALPELPQTLTDLDVHTNELAALPKLPQTLTRLDADFNRLTALPTLPQTLKGLYVSCNQLTALPELPPTLMDLYVRCNQLTALPELPQTLTDLSADYNQLAALPTLFQTLTNLDAGNNRLTELPALPQTLEVLHVSDNQLTVLPELPEGLKNLDASKNRLEALPTLPQTLTHCYVRGNPLINIPANIRLGGFQAIRQWQQLQSSQAPPPVPPPAPPPAPPASARPPERPAPPLSMTQQRTREQWDVLAASLRTTYWWGVEKMQTWKADYSHYSQHGNSDAANEFNDKYKTWICGDVSDASTRANYTQLSWAIGRVLPLTA